MNYDEQKTQLNAALADLEALVTKHGPMNIAAAIHAVCIKSIDFAQAMIRVAMVAQKVVGTEQIAQTCQCETCRAQRPQA